MNVLLASCLLFLFFDYSSCSQTTDPFYVIAHMANSGPSIDYAVGAGANAVEVDLKFYSDGSLDNFEHGGACDCTCSIPEMCAKGLGKSCSGSTASNGIKSHLAKILEHKDKIALVMIDSKVSLKIVSAMQRAGEVVVNVLIESLLERGYRGDIVISNGNPKAYEYIRKAAETARKSKYNERFYFAFDQMSNEYTMAVGLLSQMGVHRRVFGTGISTCVAKTYYDGIKAAVRGRQNGEVGLSYIWTIDKESSMKEYINIGVHGIMTNNPNRLRNLAVEKGLTLATPRDHIPNSPTEVKRSDGSCDCDYHKGGCTISLPAAPFSSCKCRYVGAWTCRGRISNCNSQEQYCKVPDGSLASCRLGGGDCDAYK